MFDDIYFNYEHCLSKIICCDKGFYDIALVELIKCIIL